jgi:hypothetical protein
MIDSVSVQGQSCSVHLVRQHVSYET